MLKKKVMSGLFWTAGARLLAQLFTWCITIVIIRLLSPSDYGLMELAGVFVAFLAMLNELGLGAAVIHRRDIDNNTLRSLFGLVLLASVAFYVLLAASAPLIAHFYDDPRLVLLVRVLALQFLLMGFAVMPQSILVKEMAFKKIAAVDFVSAISGSLTTLALALSGYGVWSLVWGSLVIRIVSTIGLNIARPFLHLPRVNMKGVWEYFSYGGYVTLSRIFWYFYSRADILIIGKLLGQELLGYYSIGLYLASLPMEKVSGIINQVAFPAFSSVQSDPGVAAQHFLKAVRVLSFISFPVLWGVSSIAPEVVTIFLGAKWSAATLPLQIISLVIPVRMISNLLNPAVLGAGRSDAEFHNTLVAFVLMPVAFFVGSFWGLLGVCLAWIIVFPLVFFLNLSRVVKILGVKLSDVLCAMRTPFLGGLIMFCVVLLVKIYLVMNIQSLPKMIILILCGGITYSFMVLRFNRSGLREVRALAKI
jgi:O-antigen/teichoic acid export membrane protein